MVLWDGGGGLGCVLGHPPLDGVACAVSRPLTLREGGCRPFSVFVKGVLIRPGLYGSRRGCRVLTVD